MGCILSPRYHIGYYLSNWMSLEVLLSCGHHCRQIAPEMQTTNGNTAGAFHARLI
jgi:hypothetical protein